MEVVTEKGRGIIGGEQRIKTKPAQPNYLSSGEGKKNGKRALRPEKDTSTTR